MKFIILAAGKGSRLYKKTKKNKCLLKIGKKTLIEKTLYEINKTKVKDISIVVGFNSHKIKSHLKKYDKINYIFNNKYNSKEMLYSLILALKKFNDDIIVGYSDVIISHKVINKILRLKKSNITIPILSNWKKIWNIRKKDPYKDAETLFVNNNMELKSIGQKIIDIDSIKYQFMGLIYIPQNKKNIFIEQYNKIRKKNKLHLTTFINELVKKKIKVNCIKTNEKWYEFDDYEDFINYKNLI